MGAAAPDRLAEPPAAAVVQVEGPRRYTPLDVAATLSDLSGREVVPRALPREEWAPALTRGGRGASCAELVATMFDAHNAGSVDVDPRADEVRHGQTELRDVLAPLLR